MTVTEAAQFLMNALREDKTEGSYYYAWQSNIAMAFYDEYNVAKEKWHIENPYIQFMPDIHKIANDAAKRFLDSFCSQPESTPENTTDNNEILN